MIAAVLPVASISFAAPVSPPNNEPTAAPVAANLSDASAAAATTCATGWGKPATLRITTVTITPVPTETFVSKADRSIFSPNK